MAQLQLPHLGKERDVPGIGAGKPTLDVIDAKLVQPFGDQELVGDGKGNPLPLGTVAKGGIVDLELGCFHKKSPGGHGPGH